MMFNFEFLITPIGLIVLGTAFLLATLHVLSSNRSLKDLKNTRDALLVEAKKQSLRSFSVVTSINNNADEAMPLIHNLLSQKYEALQLVIFLNPLAKRGTLSRLRTYRREFASLHITIISGRKSISDMYIARKYATGEYMIKLSPDQKVTPNFFTAISYALIKSPQALNVRMFIKPGESLTNVFYSLRSLWSSLLQYVSKRSVTGKQLSTGVVIDRITLSKGRFYTTRTVMFEEFAIEVSKDFYKHQTNRSLASALGIFLVLALCTAILGFTLTVTPLSVYILSLSLLIGAYLVSSSLLLLGNKGLTIPDKITLFLLIPFYPIWIAIAMLLSSIVTLSKYTVASTRKIVKAS